MKKFLLLLFLLAAVVNLNYSQLKQGATMEKITSKDGTVISFAKSGSGPPLLLVHGTTANKNRWTPLLPYFEKDFTVYAMNRRGREESGDSPEYNIMREAEDIAAIVNSIDEPVYILAHSFGAVCSLEGALLTSNIKKLILYEPPIPVGLPSYPPDVPDRMQTLIEKGELANALELFFRKIVKMPDHEFEKYKKLPVYKERILLAPTIPREMTFDRYYTFDSKKFENFKIPTLLLLGGESPLFFRKGIELINTALSNSKIIVFQNQQHIAMDTNPELFVKEVLKFLSEE